MSVSYQTVKPDQEGQRLDNWLMARLKGVPRGLVYRMLRTGQVRVNGGRAKPHQRLNRGDQVRIPPVRRRPGSSAPGPDAERVAALMDRVVYEDERLMVIDKPASIPVHAGSGIHQGLIETLNAGDPENPRLHLVHRLDRDTSGCLLLAKRADALRELHGLIRQGSVEKHYLALVAGNWRDGRVVDVPLAGNRLRGGERMVEASAEGRRAATRFNPLRAYSGATLIEAVLITGRKHQIRVHAAYEGHPAAGDRKYGDAEFNRRLAQLGLKRLFLHAHRLHFRMDDGREVDASAPLPNDLKSVLDALEEDRAGSAGKGR